MIEGLPILIVEDEALLALDLAYAVEDLGGVVVGPVATVAEALILIAGQDIAAAVLDANLADRDVTPVAIMLIGKAVPFVVHTGTGLPAELGAAFPAIAVVRKPVAAETVLACLMDRIGKG